MEFLLLWIDDLDDALGALRHLAPRLLARILTTLLATLAAAALLAATGFALVFAPHVIQAFIAVVLCATLIEAVRRRRLRAIAKRDSN